jgi:hypothetical protein
MVYIRRRRGFKRQGDANYGNKLQLCGVELLALVAQQGYERPDMLLDRAKGGRSGARHQQTAKFIIHQPSDHGARCCAH